jgi:uracil-DNA glycosylase family 4
VQRAKFLKPCCGYWIKMTDARRLVHELRARAELSDESDWATTPVLTKEAAVAAVPEGLAGLAATVAACRKCPLGSQRLNPAFGVGNAQAEVMFIGEGPGFDEDRQGEPFVGKAGQLLDKILVAMGLNRQAVYIANIVKCHPMLDPSTPEKRGNDRPPTPDEMAACRDYLEEQVRLVRPRFIVALGGIAAKALLHSETGIMKLRGQWHEFVPGAGLAPIPVMPTFHPAALLRNPEWKRDVWEDMKKLKTALESES